MPPRPGPRRARGDHGLARDLAAAGFTGVAVADRPGWHATERALWEAVLRAEPDGDPALSAFREEASGILPAHENRRRVLATAIG